MVDVTVGGRRLTMEIGVPVRPVRARELLPLFRQVADTLAAVAAEEMGKAGRAISCRAGCAACCRQPVPVALAEARELVAMVEKMPEPKRSEIRGRFADARRRMEEDGLLETFLHPDAIATADKQALAIRYVRLGIACPFLENEQCSIYAERPITCREYLVVSPAENCGQMGAMPVERVKLPAGSMSPAVSRLEQPKDDPAAKWVMLALAPDYVTANPREPEARPGPELIERFFRQTMPAKNAGE